MLSGGVAEVGGETSNTLAVHGAVGDQSHGPRDEIVADVPFRRARRRVRTTALARAKSGTLRSCRGRKEPHVTGERRSDRTAGPAIYPGGPHGGDKPAVEPSVLGLDCSIAAVEVFVHGSTITPGHRHFWRESDIVVLDGVACRGSAGSVQWRGDDPGAASPTMGRARPKATKCRVRGVSSFRCSG